MKRTPRTIGFIQAVGIAAYVALFATLAYQVRTWVTTSAVVIHPIAGILLFLLAFIISALACGSIALAYPASAFFEGRRIEALKIVLWNAVGLILIFFLAALAALTVGLAMRP